MIWSEFVASADLAFGVFAKYWGVAGTAIGGILGHWWARTTVKEDREYEENTRRAISEDERRRDADTARRTVIIDHGETLEKWFQSQEHTIQIGPDPEHPVFEGSFSGVSQEQENVNATLRMLRFFASGVLVSSSEDWKRAALILDEDPYDNLKFESVKGARETFYSLCRREIGLDVGRGEIE